MRKRLVVVLLVLTGLFAGIVPVQAHFTTHPTNWCHDSHSAWFYDSPTRRHYAVQYNSTTTRIYDSHKYIEDGVWKWFIYQTYYRVC